VIAPTPVSGPQRAASRPRFYPMLALIALAGLLFGPIGRQIGDDMPEGKTHPYYPDHFWPYPLLAMGTLITHLQPMGGMCAETAAAATLLVVVPANPWRAKQRLAAAKINCRRRSLVMRRVDMSA